MYFFQADRSASSSRKSSGSSIEEYSTVYRKVSQDDMLRTVLRKTSFAASGAGVWYGVVTAKAVVD